MRAIGAEIRISRMIDGARLQTGEEGLPLMGSGHERGAGRVLAVSCGDAARRCRDLDAARLRSAAAAGRFGDGLSRWETDQESKAVALAS